MNDIEPTEVSRFEARIGAEDTARFARALGYTREPRHLAPPTYPAKFLAEHLRQLAASTGGELVHVAQSFSYSRRPQIGQTIQCRIFSQSQVQGERREAIVTLVLCDLSGIEIARSESRLVIAELS